MATSVDFRQTWLWRKAFVDPFPEIAIAEQEYFRDRYLSMREKAATLVAQISPSIPGLTVHDISHLDALWETASLVTEDAIILSPAEAFVFGASILLHDSAMSLAAYPNGLEDLKRTIEWKDLVAAILGDIEHEPEILDNPPPDILRTVVPQILRQLHAKQAEALATQGWANSSGEVIYLIDDTDLRFFYGRTIGLIAHSHWWSVAQVEQNLSEHLGAFSSKTKSIIDLVKIACLLRIADALHLDQRRAPRFLRALVHPNGLSAYHWTFQERLAFPMIDQESVVFTSCTPFCIEDAEAWWLAYDTICAVDLELRNVDMLMQNRSRGEFFRAKRVKGAGSPELLSRTIQTNGWRPVDTQFRVSNIPKLVETLGGAKLYGDDPTIVLRELIQNGADAIQARRCFQNRNKDWGTITVAILKKAEGHWLSIEDNGIGMSEQVLTGPLIDFGYSFWRSSLATQEFPGLISSGMNAIGRYGIGFFSVFMLGSVVRVTSRRCDYGEDSARILEFRDGTSSRPILIPATKGQAPIDGGTRVEILLKVDPFAKEGLLYYGQQDKYITLGNLIASLAPSVDVKIETIEDGIRAMSVLPGDWLDLNEEDLLSRLSPQPKSNIIVDGEQKSTHHDRMRTIYDDNGIAIGRASISPNAFYEIASGWVTIGGLRATRLSNIQGILVGKTLTASRTSSIPMVSYSGLSRWATEQAAIICGAKISGHTKLKCSEIVLECGGKLGGLPILQWGDNWLSSDEFETKISTIKELLVSFNGSFDYDEDDDDVLPREFNNEFEIDPDIIIVPRHNASMLKIGRQTWPNMITGKEASNESNLEIEVRKIINTVWGDDISEDYDTRIVGSVSGTCIRRNICVFYRD